MTAAGLVQLDTQTRLPCENKLACLVCVCVFVCFSCFSCLFVTHTAVFKFLSNLRLAISLAHIYIHDPTDPTSTTYYCCMQYLLLRRLLAATAAIEKGFPPTSACTISKKQHEARQHCYCCTKYLLSLMAEASYAPDG